MSVSQPQKVWHWAILSIVTLLSFTFILYHQTVFYLGVLWNKLNVGEYGHGYLVLAISAYLIFNNRRQLSVHTPSPEYRAIPAVVIAVVFWTAAALVDVAVLQAVGLLLLVLTIMWALLGTQVIRILFFPVVFISFAIPVWFPLSPLMQEVTADVVFWMIRVLDVPAHRVENMIVLPSGRLSIEEACSGLRYFLAALTLGTLYAYLNYSKLTARLAIVLVFAGAAVLANILRVFIVVYLAYTSEMQHPLVRDHLNLGWYLFAGLIFFLLVVEIFVLRTMGSKEVTRRTANTPTPITTVNGKPNFLLAVLLLVFLLAMGPLSISWLTSQAQEDRSLVQVLQPREVGVWSIVDTERDEWMPRYSGAINNKMGFSDGDEVVYLYVGLYSSQRQGEELINDLNRISDNKIWRIKYQGAKLYNMGDWLVYEQLLEKKDGSQRLVWFWYRVAEKNTVNKYEAKYLQVMGLLTGKQYAAVIAVASEIDIDAHRVRIRLKRFAVEMNTEINNMVDSEKQPY